MLKGGFDLEEGVLRREVPGYLCIGREDQGPRAGRDWRGLNPLLRFFNFQIGHIIIDADM